MTYYAVQLVRCNGTPSEFEPSLYGGDRARTIKEAIARASAGEHDPEKDSRILLGRDNPESMGAEDIRGLIHNEADRVYAVETLYGLQYFNVSGG